MVTWRVVALLATCNLASLTSADMATEPWKPRVSALFRQHRCTAAYLDVGTNIGVQLRKLFEPHRF